MENFEPQNRASEAPYAPEAPREPDNPNSSARWASAGLSVLAVVCLTLAIRVPEAAQSPLFLQLFQSGAQRPDYGKLSLLGGMTALVVLPLAGFLGDRFGRLRIILLGAAIAGTGLLLAGLQGNYLLLSYGLVNAGFSACAPNLLALALQSASSRRLLGTAAAFFLTMGNLTALLAPWMAGAILGRLDTRGLFLILLVLLLLLTGFGLALTWLARRAWGAETQPAEWFELPSGLPAKAVTGWLIVVIFLGSLVSQNYQLTLRHFMQYFQAIELGMLTALLQTVSLLSIPLFGLLIDGLDWQVERRTKRRLLGRSALAAAGLLLALGNLRVGFSHVLPSLNLGEGSQSLALASNYALGRNLSLDLFALALLTLFAGCLPPQRWGFFLGIRAAIAILTQPLAAVLSSSLGSSETLERSWMLEGGLLFLTLLVVLAGSVYFLQSKEGAAQGGKLPA